MVRLASVIGAGFLLAVAARNLLLSGCPDRR
jgi:hypothetical protein